MSGWRVDAPLLNRYISQAPSTSAILELHQAHGWQMDAMHYGNLWNKLGKARRSAAGGAAADGMCAGSLDELVEASIAHVDAYGPQQLANIAHGAALAAVSGKAAQALFASLAARVLEEGGLELLATFEPRHLANFAWGFATASQASRELFKAIARASRPLLRLPIARPDSPAPGGRGSLHGKGKGKAFGRLRGAGRGKGESSPFPVGFNEQELAMLAFAFSKAEYGSISVSLARHVRKGVSSLTASQVAALAPLLVKLALQSGVTAKQRDALVRSLKALARSSRSLLTQMNAADLEITASAYARLSLRKWGTRFTRSLAAAAVDVLSADIGHDSHGEACSRQQLAPRRLTNLLWAVAKLASCCKLARKCVVSDPDVVGFAAAVSLEISKRLETSAGMPTADLVSQMAFNSRDLSNAAWALLTLGRVDKRCMTAIGRAATPIISSFNAQECSKLLGSLEKARIRVDLLETAASTLREIKFAFAPPIGEVSLRHSVGGGRSLAGGPPREETGATALTGFALWEDALVLAEWLSRLQSPAALHQIEGGVPLNMIPSSLLQRSSWQDVHAVEVGAGIGLCAVVAARLGMQVVATDGDERIVGLIESNLGRNQVASSLARATRLRWGEADAMALLGLNHAPEILIATGCVYGSSAEVWDALIRTLDELSGPETLVLLVHGNGTAPGTLQLRGRFYEIAEKRFRLADVPLQALASEHDGCRLHCMRKRA